jgi:hypothetical protein
MPAMASSSLLNEFGPHTYPERGPRALRVSGDVDVTEDGFCFGQIKGDPDIAGWGVRHERLTPRRALPCEAS